ncbi:DUF4554 domain-containing protein isoform X2 [Oryzias melastigma]|uniref:DUF4554 domain-containing protein isoform X2 n=1 Tax=Oryzias melastigma TaxID=30732 RepID=UPI000CF8369C|nr:DUF4554 domain-containing protein isoform X2 [Oryzias melastigma]
MLHEIRQVLRLVMLMSKQGQRHGSRSTGGLLIVVWDEAGAQRLNCTVAAAGSWCSGIEMKALQLDLKDSMFAGVSPSLHPDPEDLIPFSDLYGSLRFLLSFQMKDVRPSDWLSDVEAVLRAFCLANAGIKIHLKLKFAQQTFERDFRAKIKAKVSGVDHPSLLLDVSCPAEKRWFLPKPHGSVKKASWCQGGHPVDGGRLPLSIPPQAMDGGLLGDLCVRLVTLLHPCVLQYPNLPTELKSIEVLVYNPCNIPVSGSTGFFQTLPSSLDCQHLGLHGLQCPAHKGHRVGAVYTTEQWDDEEQEPNHLPVQQNLLVFLLFQHRDPFCSHLSDFIDMLIEHHLEEILNSNKPAVTAAIRTEIGNTMKTQNRRKKQQEKLNSAAEVILGSTLSIVSCSSNMDFRNACFNLMKVTDSHALSSRLSESLRGVMSWRFLPVSRCYSTQMEENLLRNESTKSEI